MTKLVNLYHATHQSKQNNVLVVEFKYFKVFSYNFVYLDVSEKIDDYQAKRTKTMHWRAKKRNLKVFF